MQCVFKTTLRTTAILLMATVVMGCMSNRFSSLRSGNSVVAHPRPTPEAAAYAAESEAQTRSQISRTVPKVHRSPEVIREKIAELTSADQTAA